MLQAVATITKNHTTTCRDCPFPHRFKKGDLCLRIADESRRPGESFHLCLKHALRNIKQELQKLTHNQQP